MEQYRTANLIWKWIQICFCSRLSKIQNWHLVKFEPSSSKLNFVIFRRLKTQYNNWFFYYIYMKKCNSPTICLENDGRRNCLSKNITCRKTRWSWLLKLLRLLQYRVLANYDGTWWFCTCVLSFCTFLCRPLQNNNVK